jgi:lipopolysaccharide biosynthesis regulator YciM
VSLAGIGWRYYALKSRHREKKALKWLWNKREDAIAYSLKGFHQDAIDSFEKIIDKEHPHVELYVSLAEAFERQNDPQKAIENYNSILARHPQNMRALFGAAANWETLGNYTEAIALYTRILDVDPNSPYAIRKKQALLEQSGQYAEAIEAYQRSGVTLDSQETQEKLASLYYRLAVKQLKDSDLRSAERTLKDGRKVYDYYVPSMLILANLYMKTDRERDARKIWEQTADNTLSTIIFNRLEDYFYNQKGDPRENLKPVIERYNQLIDAHDANHLRLALGKLYLKLELYDEAEHVLLEFQSHDQSIPQVHLLLADLYHRSDKVDKALEEYRFASELVDIKIADFKCFHCGAMYEYWADQCTSCKSWGTIEDMFFTKGPRSLLPELKQKPMPQLATTSEESPKEQVVSAS